MNPYLDDDLKNLLINALSDKRSFEKLSLNIEVTQ